MIAWSEIATPLPTAEPSLPSSPSAVLRPLPIYKPDVKRASAAALQARRRRAAPPHPSSRTRATDPRPSLLLSHCRSLASTPWPRPARSSPYRRPHRRQGGLGPPTEAAGAAPHSSPPHTRLPRGGGSGPGARSPLPPTPAGCPEARTSLPGSGRPSNDAGPHAAAAPPPPPRLK